MKPSERIREIAKDQDLSIAAATMLYLDEREEQVHPIARVVRRTRPEHPGVFDDEPAHPAPASPPIEEPDASGLYHGRAHVDLPGVRGAKSLRGTASPPSDESELDAIKRILDESGWLNKGKPMKYSVVALCEAREALAKHRDSLLAEVNRLNAEAVELKRQLEEAMRMGEQLAESSAVLIANRDAVVDATRGYLMALDRGENGAAFRAMRAAVDALSDP